MLVLIWATLLFSVRGSNADTGACQGEFCITLNEGEITGEVGLCVVIPCSFTTKYDFTPRHIVWYKCEQSRCGESDIIFQTDNNRQVQSGFEGRVSLLESDVSQKNCSIIINDLTESDSGSYQLRVTGVTWYEWADGFTFSQKATVSVKDLIQKPTVMIPPLTEGQQTTLTCTAPGLCCGSAPEITWTWRGPGENDSHITGNITAYKTENLTAVSQRHSSTLMFNSSAELHGTNVTCRVSFTNNITTEETVTLNVTYVKKVKITGKTSLKEGETLNLTCSLESFPPSIITWTIYSEKNKLNRTETILQNNTETYQQEESGLGTFSISNVTAEDSGQYTCTAKHLNNTLIQKVDVKVMYMKKPKITGNTIVEEGDALNLTCSIESFPLSHIMWTVLGSNTHLHNGPDTDLQNDSGSATLVIYNVTVEHSGQYICTAKYLDTTLTTYADINVTLYPKILNSSGCRNQSEVLTCMCISEGFPLPTIKWPLLKDHTEYSVITTVSKHTVNSTITLKANDHSSTVVQCVSSNENMEAKENFTIRINASDQEDHSSKLLKMVSWLKIIIPFLIGVLFSAVLCSLTKKCHRKKLNSVNLDETLQMVTSQKDPLIAACRAVEDDQTYYQEAAEEGGEVPVEKTASDLDGGAKDVEYASIDFSVLKRKSPREATKRQETTETEYAEIKKQVKEEKEDDDREEGEVLEGKKEEAMIGEDEESKHCVSEGEDVEVYSNVKDIMGQI